MSGYATFPEANLVQEWHIGETSNLKNIKNNVRFMTEIQVDGDELDAIIRTSPIPIAIPAGKRVVHLYGDIARTAMLNL